MSHPKPSEIWEAVFPTDDTSDIITRPVLILSTLSAHKTCLVTPLLAEKPDEPKFVQIDKDRFLIKKPLAACYVNLYNIYPMDLTLFTSRCAEIDTADFERIRSAINELIQKK
jgi:hypothetical protein